MLVVGLALTPAAVAGPQEEAAAEALFLEGRKLLEQGHYDQACPKFVESQQLDPAVGTLLYLGECYARNGQLASAWATFQSAAAAARNSHQPERERIASERARHLLPRAPKIAISVSPPRPAGLQITRDGSGVGEAAWGEAVPVDPGEHTIVAQAPGKSTWIRKVDAKPGAVTRVEIPALDDSPIAPAALPGATKPVGSTEAQPNTAAHSTSEPIATGPSALRAPPPPSIQRTAAYVAGGVGAAGLVFGAAFGVVAKKQERDSEAYCRADNPSLCGQTGLERLADARSTATIANVGLVVGGVALAAGVILYLTAPPAPGGGARAGATGDVGAGAKDGSAGSLDDRVTAFVRASANGVEVAGTF